MKKVYKKIIKYLALTFVNLKNSTTYKSEFVFISIRNIIVILIFINFYSLTFKSSGASEFDGLGLNQILWLLIFIRTFAIDWSTTTLINNEIRSGDLAYTATRPYSYILSHYASFYGRRLPQFLFGDIPSNLIPAFFLVDKINISFMTVVACVPLVIFGITIEFLAQVIIGLLTFWMDDVTALKWIYQKLQVIFGGVLIPIAMFPENMQMFTQLLPFRSVYYNPCKTLVNFNTNLFLQTLFIQILWVTLIFIIAHKIFKKGMKNVSIQGG
jgi:ABC-2 type transport system permease protein